MEKGGGQRDHKNKNKEHEEDNVGTKGHARAIGGRKQREKNKNAEKRFQKKYKQKHKRYFPQTCEYLKWDTSAFYEWTFVESILWMGIDERHLREHYNNAM